MLFLKYAIIIEQSPRARTIPAMPKYFGFFVVWPIPCEDRFVNWSCGIIEMTTQLVQMLRNRFRSPPPAIVSVTAARLSR